MELLSKLTAGRLLSVLLLLLVSFALYLPSLKNDFVWDDVEVITKSNVSLDAAYITDVVIPDVYKHKSSSYYRPAIYTSLVADRAFWGLSPFGYHLSNLLFNTISVILFYFMTLTVLDGLAVNKAGAPAMLSSVLFALYPMHVESVSWIAGRSDIICAMFLFPAMAFHIMSSKSQWLLAPAALCFALSLMSKEVAVVFPFLAVSYDLLAGRFSDRRNLLRYALYILIIILYLYVRSRAFVSIPEVAHEVSGKGSSGVSLIQGSGIRLFSHFWEFSKILLGSYFFYLNKLILPFDFNPFVTNVPRTAPYLISSAALLSALAALGILSVRKKENVTAFGILWVLFTLGPSALIAIFSIAATPLAERYLYIPSAGLCLVIGNIIVVASQRARARNFVAALGAVLIIISAFASYERQAVWRDDLSLWRDASAKSPYHPLPHSNYGLALSNAGEYDEAIKELRIALSPELNDNPRGLAMTANNLALVYLDKGDYENAEKWFRKALEYDPDYGKTYYHMGLIYYINGELTGSADSYRQAEAYVKEAMKRYKYYGRANLLLAKIYLRMGDRARAEQEARDAVAIGLPDNLLKEARNILEIDDGSGDQEPHQH
ncbi:MAG TPA: tetratricopeptide repeat protein [Thermodesulfobacteriota bacterium]|nr:tetratricopeptide repeat protein [Thermodesulfobacteriota bacterium]